MLCIYYLCNTSFRGGGLFWGLDTGNRGFLGGRNFSKIIKIIKKLGFFPKNFREDPPRGHGKTLFPGGGPPGGDPGGPLGNFSKNDPIF